MVKRLDDAIALPAFHLASCLETGFPLGMLIPFLLSLVFWFWSTVSHDLKQPVYLLSCPLPHP